MRERTVKLRYFTEGTCLKKIDLLESVVDKSVGFTRGRQNIQEKENVSAKPTAEKLIVSWKNTAIEEYHSGFIVIDDMLICKQSI